MCRCLALAETARADGDVPVGALVVLRGRVVGEGVEGVRALSDPAAHAELAAVRAACQTLGTRDLSGAALYTTAEPCVMCSYAVRQTRIALVVMGAPVPFVGGATSAYPLLRDISIPAWAEPPVLVWDVLSGLCQALREAPP